MKKIAFYTLGCKLNFSETSFISNDFIKGGYEIVGFNEIADYYVINSCSVTAKAEKKCKTLIKQISKRVPEAYIVVVGCFSQINPDEISELQGVKMILGNDDKFDLYKHINSIANNKTKKIVIKPYNEAFQSFEPSYSIEGRTRSFFKVQDGCDYNCAYCTVPLARGSSRSNTIKETIKTAEEIVENNIKEIVLSGINLGDFGKNHGESFYELLKEMVKIEEIERIRISSIEPDLLSDEIIKLVADERKLMPHFHIPLQSGSNAVLQSMKRRYSRELFSSRVEKIKSLMPKACIAVDLIVGYPIETRQMFNESVSFINDTDISYLHVFTYSERKNTKAINLSSTVPLKERKERSEILHELSEKKKKTFYLNNVNNTLNVLWEKENVNGFMYGFTENYIRVKTKFSLELTNEVTTVRLNTIIGNNVFSVDVLQ